MKLSRLIAAGGAFALVGASTLVAGGAAFAHDGSTAGNPTTYVAGSTFPAETSPYPAGWFKGTIANPGTLASTVGGLSITGAVQLLNGTPGTGSLSTLVDAAGLTNSGDANFQISLFANGTTGFTTLHPLTDGDAGLTSTGMWETSQVIAADATNGNGIAYAAGADASLADLEAAIGSDATLLAFGAIVPVGHSAVISSITWNGKTYRFTPHATGTVTPSKLSQKDFTTAGKGVTATFSGFIPGESVQPGYGTGGEGDTIGGPIVADANGSITVTWVAPSSFAAGTNYDIAAFGATSGVDVQLPIVVTANAADPAVPAGPTLATTGADPTELLGAAGILFVAGIAAIAFALYRRRALR
ncbi:MAG TPA: hypothetical protein VGM94_18445 [Galbitalea sp.]